MKKGDKVYIAGPLTSSGEVKDNIIGACKAFVELAEMGLVPFVPHLSWYITQNVDIGWRHADWIVYCLDWVAVCDAVLRLPGESKGADVEVSMARKWGIEVFHSIEDIRKMMEDDNEMSSVRSGDEVF